MVQVLLSSPQVSQIADYGDPARTELKGGVLEGVSHCSSWNLAESEVEYTLEGREPSGSSGIGPYLAYKADKCSISAWTPGSDVRVA